MSEKPQGELKRTLGLFSLVAYGVGDILGAGIYALVGKIAGLVGSACWISFLISFFVAALTGLSYAELGSRFPKSAGETHYTLKAFHKPVLAYAVGFLVLMSGVVSMAAVSHGFGGYVRALFPGVSLWAVILVFFTVLGAISFWGMRESSVTNIVCTAVELAGLLIVIAIGLAHFGRVDYLEFATAPEGTSPWGAVFQGSVLAFYAFIGFEDMVKASEESHSPAKLIPRAILISLALIGVFYILTALAAVSVVPAQELAASQAPLMTVVERGAPGFPRGMFTFIALFAVTNTALVNFVMSSRLLYGMAREGLVPSVLGRVHPVRSTPHWAIGVVFVLALTLALTGTLSRLAQSTATLLLIVFVFVNVSLAVLKIQVKSQGASKPHESARSEGFFSVPVFVPILGALTALFLLAHVSASALVTAAVLLAVALALFLLAKLVV